jgi:hypothetical protein
MARKDVIKKALRPKLGVTTPIRLRPVFMQFQLESVPAGAEFLLAPAFAAPAGVHVVVADGAGTDYYRLDEVFRMEGGAQIWLKSPLTRAYSEATVMVAGGHAPAVRPAEELCLECYIDPENGALITAGIHVDEFDAQFGEQFPTALPLMAKPNVHGKLRAATADQQWQKQFDRWRDEGLIL